MKMKTERKYVVRRRVVASIIAIAVTYGAVEVITHLWWTPAGYCWGSVEKCEGGL